MSGRVDDYSIYYAYAEIFSIYCAIDVADRRLA